MIFSTSHKFIFARGIKTASTSLANELESKIRKSEQSIPYKLVRRIPGLSEKYPFYDFRNHPHVTLSKARNIIPESEFELCKKFGVVREPISWMVSCYKHWERVYKKVGKNNINSLEDFVLYFEDNKSPLQLMQFVGSNGFLLSDFVGNFHLMNSFSHELESILGFSINIKHLNVAPKNQKVLISRKEKSLIEKVCELDYLLFNFDEINYPIIPQNLNLNQSIRNRISKSWIENGGFQYEPWRLFHFS